jgi:hypothetical protein
MVNQVMVVNVKLSKWWLQFNNWCLIPFQQFYDFMAISWQSFFFRWMKQSGEPREIHILSGTDKPCQNNAPNFDIQIPR